MNRKPGFTMTPSDLMLDATLNCYEYRVLMIICRQTYGWHKDTDRISLSQFEKYSNMSRSSIQRAIKSLSERGYIEKSNDGKFSACGYSIKHEDHTDSVVSQTKGGGLTDQGGGLTDQRRVVSQTNTIYSIYTNTKYTSQNIYDRIIRYWNKITDKNITLTSNRKRLIKNYLKDYPLKHLLYSIVNLSRDKWSIDNSMLSIERLLERDKMDSNHDKFYKFPFAKKRVEPRRSSESEYLSRIRELDALAQSARIDSKATQSLSARFYGENRPTGRQNA